MSEILNQLAHLFLQATPTVVIVFVLFVVLDRIFFRPLAAVLKQREESTVGALARAREQAAAAEAKSREYEEAFQTARQDIYRRREAERRVRMQEREETLQKAREQAEVMTREAQAQIGQEVARVQAELETACRSLAEEISERLVGPSTSAGAGGARR